MKKVQYLTPKKNLFSDAYLAVRKKENRLYDDDIVKNLPNIPSNHIYKKEWNLRIKSTNRIVNYLKSKNKSLKILDIGCGNGWFSNQLSTINNATVFAIDINPDELEQGNRIFQQNNLTFIYADIFNVSDLNGFDIITINSCIQYFDDISNFINTLKNRLNDNGEIHIIDSPFYKKNEIESAKNRTEKYYQSIGFAEMSKNYFHHSLEKIQDFNILYNPKKSIFKKIFSPNDSPFMWILIR